MLVEDLVGLGFDLIGAPSLLPFRVPGCTNMPEFTEVPDAREHWNLQSFEFPDTQQCWNLQYFEFPDAQTDRIHSIFGCHMHKHSRTYSGLRHKTVGIATLPTH